MTTLYILEHDDVYNVYTTREKAKRAKLIYLNRVKATLLAEDEDLTEEEANEQISFLEPHIYIREIKEGTSFGEGIYSEYKRSNLETRDIFVD